MVFNGVKSKKNILSFIHNLPEGVRVLLASFFMLAAAVFLFNSWTEGVSSSLRVTSVSESALSKEALSGVKYGAGLEENRSPSASAISSPLASIGDSFQSFIGMFGPSLPAGGLGNVSEVKQGFYLLVSDINGFLGRTWKYVYSYKDAVWK